MAAKDPVAGLMAKLEAFELANPTLYGPRCGGCLLPIHAKHFMRDARKRGATFRTIAGVLKGEGHTLSAFTVARHLREHGQ